MHEAPVVAEDVGARPVDAAITTEAALLAAAGEDVSAAAAVISHIAPDTAAVLGARTTAPLTALTDTTANAELVAAVVGVKTSEPAVAHTAPLAATLEADGRCTFAVTAHDALLTADDVGERRPGARIDAIAADIATLDGASGWLLTSDTTPP